MAHKVGFRETKRAVNTGKGSQLHEAGEIQGREGEVRHFRAKVVERNIGWSHVMVEGGVEGGGSVKRLVHHVSGKCWINSAIQLSGNLCLAETCVHVQGY